MKFFGPRLTSSRMLRRLSVFGAMAVALFVQSPSAQAHPLGNFTTNTALQLTVSPNDVRGLYVVDFAEIPALQIRQKLGYAKAPVPADVATSWGVDQCALLSRGVDLASADKTVAWTRVASSAVFLPGQAGLTTLRLECRWRVDVASVRSLSVDDTNFADRQGWREITATGTGTALTSELRVVSPSNLLRKYPTENLGAPSNVRRANIDVIANGSLCSKRL